jgi:DNA-binding HxlR family transcriptional regulator
MHRKRFDEMNCSIARALDEIGERWTLLIIWECTAGASRFEEFRSRLGIARNILSTRLERLVELGIFERFRLASRANTDGYRLTKKGEDLQDVISALEAWSDQWVVDRPECKAANQNPELLSKFQRT